MGYRTLKFLQVEDLYDALLSNAYYLSVDAEVLLAKSSVGRARAFAILALEECGKAIMIHEAKVASFGRGEADPVLDTQFWKDWRTHRPKLRRVRDFLLREDYWFDIAPPPVSPHLLGPVEDYLAELDRFAAEGDSSKMNGLYVDVDPATGRTRAPEDDTNADQVTELLLLAHQIGWQLRLGDHIQFIAGPRNMGQSTDSLYSKYADGGALAGSRGERGWEAHSIELLRMVGD
jgi:AbiV family abortive infection protein